MALNLSRGIPKKYAQRMLLEAFYIDILNRINVPKIQSMVETNLKNLLEETTFIFFLLIMHCTEMFLEE